MSKTISINVPDWNEFQSITTENDGVRVVITNTSNESKNSYKVEKFGAIFDGCTFIEFETIPRPWNIFSFEGHDSHHDAVICGLNFLMGRI